jgi:hypothetical protein
MPTFKVELMTIIISKTKQYNRDEWRDNIKICKLNKQMAIKFPLCRGKNNKLEVLQFVHVIKNI